MRLFGVSILSIFACLPVFANARLPIVNVGAGSVSARAAFGEKVETHVAAIDMATPALAARKSAALSGDKIAKIPSPADILTPRKPSGDLWARLEKPLRLPEPQEFSIIHSDFELPEEYLESAPVETSKVFGVPAVVARTSEVDAEIAKLVELQRKADESSRVAQAVKPTLIHSYDVKPTVVARGVAKSQPAVAPRPTAATIAANEEVSVRRVVVPMEEDVIVRTVRTNGAEPKTEFASNDMTKMSPSELKKAFKKTYLSENKHLSTYRIDDRFDVASDLTSEIEGFTSQRDLSETGGVRPLEIKIGFRGDDSALSRDNYNLLSEYAGIVVSNPKRAIQISIPQRATNSLDGRKLAARRLAIVEQVLHDTGVSDQRIIPVLAQRSDESFVLRVISSDQYDTMTQQKRDMFGDTVGRKTYKSMSW
jgi:outer membrane protein OmpA-like peptidoglycan-associated protein